MRGPRDSGVGRGAGVPDGLRRLLEPDAGGAEGAVAGQGGGHGVGAQVHERGRRLQSRVREDRTLQILAEVLLSI